jgi:hypothetical protein
MNIRADFDVNCYLNSDLLKSEMKRPLKWFKQDNNYVVNVKATLYFTQYSYWEVYFLDGEIQSVNVEFKGIISENGIKNFIHCFIEDMSLSFNSIEDFKINSIKTKGRAKVITSTQYDFEKDTELLKDLKIIALDECSLNFEVETISEVVYE